METDRQQNLREDRMSDCRSFGSNYRPLSQSRKVSIGVVVDSFAKTKAKNVREGRAAVPQEENVASREGKSMEDGHKGEVVTAPTNGKKTKAPEQETSPWVSTRSLHQKVTSSAEVHYGKQVSSLPATNNMHKRSSGVKEAPGTYSVQFFANQMSILQSGDGKQKKFDRVTCGRKGEKDVAAAMVEGFSFSTAQEVLVPEKEVMEDANKTENMGNATLRMKIWQILGPVSSPNKQCSNSQVLEMGANNLKAERKSDGKGTPVVNPRQNSDTIESDSESPNHTNRRPVTRSLTGKRPPTKVQPNKTKITTSSSYKQKPVEKNIFSLEEEWSGRLCGAVNGGSSMSKSKKSKRKEPFKMCFPEHDNADETWKATDKFNPEKSSLLGNRTGSFNSFLPKKNSELVEPKYGIQEKDSHPMPVADQLGDMDGPTLLENVHQQEDLANLSKNIVEPQCDLLSPIFEVKTPIKIPSPGSSPIINQGELDDRSPAERVFNMEGICSFKSLLTSKPDCCKTNAPMESSDDAGELEGSPVVKSLPIMKENLTRNRLSKSSSEESDLESSENDSLIKGHRETESLFPEVGTTEKPTFVFRLAKRHCSEEGVDEDGFTPTPDSVKVTEENNGLHRPSELNQEEDGLASAVALFALALERVKSKMNSMVSKKSSEILMSVVEEIYLQLQNAESQIQTDVGKLTSLGKSKRKRLETRFQEQQEQLKVIHERFKEEVTQHLQDCRSTFEGLEAHQIEFKGTFEKQKASHRKLVLQAEAAIESQLNDAQRKITAVHKMAREKMLQLKYVLGECLKEGFLS